MKTKAVDDDHQTAAKKVEQDMAEVEEALAETMSSTIDMQPSILRVRRQYKKRGDLVIDPEEEVEEIEVQDFHVDPAHAGLRVSHTLNLGNYWSLSVQVSLDVPCYREEYAEALEFVAKIVGERLTTEIEVGKERTSELRKDRGTGSNLF